jgi:hypothetical protein
VLRISFFFIFFSITAINLPTLAQNNSAKVTGEMIDSIKPLKHSPSRAALYSAVLPGLGQMYNKKNAFWKLPIVVGGGIALGMSIAWNNREHLRWKDAYFDKLKGIKPSNLPDLSLEGYNRIQKKYARDRDFLILLTLGAHGLQVLDAFVEAHLKTFNVDDNLAFQILPTGFSLKLDIGKRRGRQGVHKRF